ncbi:MAG TPA: hypothetical protein VGM90_19745 [Kofleriaceae bacterium]|jgi:hypothetical protein
MQLRGLVLGSLVLSACVTEDMTNDPAPTDSFEIEPGMFVSLTGSGGKADLANGDVKARPLDTSDYAVIGKYWADSRDVTVTGQPVLEWPLADSRALLDRAGTPIHIDSFVYEHTGLDVIRETEDQSPIVHAPLRGVARITDWNGFQYYPNGDYSTVISIWDPETHAVVDLMHVKPNADLPHDGTEFSVESGQEIGELAELDIPGGRHTHVTVVDAKNNTLLPPLDAFPQYIDDTPPVVKDLYFLDAHAWKQWELHDGPNDLVVTAFDRDEKSGRNLEPASAAFTVKDQTGRVIAQLDRCTFSDAFKHLAANWTTPSSTIRMIDFGNARDQVGGFWPNSDMGNPDRTFRYALTNLRLVDGECTVVADDRDGQLEITSDVQSMDVHVDLWDYRNNHGAIDWTFKRHANH